MSNKPKDIKKLNITFINPNWNQSFEDLALQARKVVILYLKRGQLLHNLV